MDRKQRREESEKKRLREEKSQKREESEKRREEKIRSEKRREEKESEERRRRRAKRQKSRETLCFSNVLGRRKVGSLKQRVRSHLARWEMKNCTQSWREPHFEVKSVKN